MSETKGNSEAVDVTKDVEASIIGGPWNRGNNKIGYNLMFKLALTDDMLVGGSVKNWAFQAGNQTATFNSLWLDGYNANVTYDKANGKFINADKSTQVEKHAGETIEFKVDVDDTGEFDKKQWSFSFQDLDSTDSEQAPPVDPPRSHHGHHPGHHHGHPRWRKHHHQPPLEDDGTEWWEDDSEVTAHDTAVVPEDLDDDAEPAASRYFSIAANPPKDPDRENAVTPPYRTKQDKPLYSYFRMGMPDVQSEKQLPKDPNEPDELGFSAPESGILLYTTGAYKQFAYTETKVEVKGLKVTANGPVLASAEYATADAKDDQIVDAVLGPTKVTVKRLNELTSSLGSKIETLMGAKQDYWQGMRTTCGAGSNFTAVLGEDIKATTQSGVAFTMKTAELSASGLVKVVGKNDVYSQGRIRFSSNGPHSEGALGPWKDHRRHIWAAFLVFEFAMAAAATVPAISVGDREGAYGAQENLDRLKQHLLNSEYELLTLSSVFTVMQVTITIAAAKLRINDAPQMNASDLQDVKPAILKLESGDPQTYLTKGPQKIILDTKTGNLVLKNGSVASLRAPTILLSSESIILGAGDSQIIIDNDGITISGNSIKGLAAPAGGTLCLEAAGATLGGQQLQSMVAHPQTTTAVANKVLNAFGALAQQAEQNAAAIGKEIASTLRDATNEQMEVAAASL